MDKAKNCIFYLFITYSVIIILLLYNSEKNAITSFEFKDTTDNIYKIIQLENQYNNLSKK